MNLPTDTRFDPPCSSGDEDGGAEGVRTPDLLNAIQPVTVLRGCIRFYPVVDFS